MPTKEERVRIVEGNSLDLGRCNFCGCQPMWTVHELSPARGGFSVRLCPQCLADVVEYAESRKPKKRRKK